MALPDQPPPFDTVVFDCDSTLSSIEGVEALARPEQRAEIERLTNAAMAGETKLEEVFGRRLDLLCPTEATLEEVAQQYIERAQPHARELMGALRSAGKHVVIVSGGLAPAVEGFARWLGIEETHAVGVRFDASGAYAGFEAEPPLARSGGKIEVLERIAARPDSGRLVLIGDGATDLEAAHLVERFIAYGGVVRRAGVFAAASVTCTSPDFSELVPLLFSQDEIATLQADPAHAALFTPPTTP